MNGDTRDALDALARWREFSEARAADTFRQRNGEAQQARTNSDDAQRKVNECQRRRAELLDTVRLDVGVLQLAEQIEAMAWQEAHKRSFELDAAEQTLDAVQTAYLSARAQTRVVEARRGRRTRAEDDRREKASFDAMADLHIAHRSTPK